ncbi:MAG: hypothetical protein L0Y44_09625 [Phycisphaerales bacterium]|nr:hypothetical protein [Phycisphaerales bacterium]MCI0676926.1 hypothetical protein [Phycisphaerales bacterium]
MRTTQERRRHNGVRHDSVEPHPLANELTADRSLQSDRPVEVHDPAVSGESAATYRSGQRDQAFTSGQRSIARQVITIVGVVVLASIVVSAILMREWVLLGLGVLLFIPFMLLLLAPVWLASTTKIAHDDTVRQQNRRYGAHGRNPSDLRNPETSPSE